jgi:hypothetical protein
VGILVPVDDIKPFGSRQAAYLAKVDQRTQPALPTEGEVAYPFHFALQTPKIR